MVTTQDEGLEDRFFLDRYSSSWLSDEKCLLRGSPLIGGGDGGLFINVVPFVGAVVVDGLAILEELPKSWCTLGKLVAGFSKRYCLENNFSHGLNTKHLKFR